MQTVISKPSIHTFVARGRVFQLLSGGQTRFNFRGVNDDWSEEVVLVAGDSLKFDRDYFNIEISSDYEQPIEFYAGFADMRRSRQDLTPVGTTRVQSRQVNVAKGEQLLIEANRTRRNLVIKALSGEVYVGGLGTSMNDKMPIEVGVPFKLETQGALYAEISPTFDKDTVDVRIIEELN
ncbi:hypothetical protein L1D14_09220 [Vibrio tubiashii]|uniref:hypothetical protein n=1 Tax=Vibrio tubiashii TaxID=29498 RepID=UPI001EFC36DC|nr:hypothetical protein [Vibrio tubiashii]MCG9576418.1 hypothetical protein [Vibrio tubiashii]